VPHRRQFAVLGARWPTVAGIITQTVTYTTSSGRAATFYLIWFVLAVALACIPAVIASGKGRSFALWWLFGLFCFLPALIVSLVISDSRVGSARACGPGPPSWSTPPPPTTPAGW